MELFDNTIAYLEKDMKSIYVTLLFFIIGCYMGAKINYGDIFNNNRVMYVKSIKKPEECNNLEEFIGDSLNVEMFHKRFFAVNESTNALYFNSTKNSYDAKNMKKIGTEYLIFLDHDCKVLEIVKKEN